MRRSATLTALLLNIVIVFAVRECCMPAPPNPAPCSHSEPISRGDTCDGNQLYTTESMKVREIRSAAEVFVPPPQLVERFPERPFTIHASTHLPSFSFPAGEDLFLRSCALLI